MVISGVIISATATTAYDWIGESVSRLAGFALWVIGSLSIFYAMKFRDISSLDSIVIDRYMDKKVGEIAELHKSKPKGVLTRLFGAE